MSFKNGHLIAMLAVGGSSFRLARTQERKFVNRFGQSIYEDLLTLQPRCDQVSVPDDFGSKVALWASEGAIGAATKPATIDLIREAIAQVEKVDPSPTFVADSIRDIA